MILYRLRGIINNVGRRKDMAKAITIALVISYLLDRQVKRRIERAKARKLELENQRIEQVIVQPNRGSRFP